MCTLLLHSHAQPQKNHSYTLHNTQYTTHTIYIRSKSYCKLFDQSRHVLNQTAANKSPRSYTWCECMCVCGGRRIICICVCVCVRACVCVSAIYVCMYTHIVECCVYQGEGHTRGFSSSHPSRQPHIAQSPPKCAQCAAS